MWETCDISRSHLRDTSVDFLPGVCGQVGLKQTSPLQYFEILLRASVSV